MIFKSINESLDKGGSQVKNNVPDLVNGIKGSITNFFSPQNIYSNSDTEKLTAYINKYSELKEKITNLQNKGIGFNVKEETIVTSAFNQTMDDASDKAKEFAKSNNAAELSLDNLKKSSKAAELGMKALAMAENMAIMAIVSFAATKLFEWYDNVAHAQEYAMERSEKLTSTYESERSTLDENISKYKELGQKLNDTSLSAEELQSVKQQLSSVQDSLNEKFGSEATQIDLVNGKYDEQIAKLDELAKKKAADYVSENADDIEQDRAYVNDRFTSITSSGIQLSNSDLDDPKKVGFDLKKDLDKYKDTLRAEIVSSYGDVSDGSFGELKLIANGTREENIKALQELSTDLLNKYGEADERVNEFRQKIASTLKNDYDTSEIEQANENLKTYAKARIDSDNSASTAYKNLDTAVENYNKALANKSGVDAAKKNLLEAKSAAEDATSGIKEADVVLDDLYKKLTPDAPIEMQIAFKGEDGQDLQNAYDSVINRFKHNTDEKSQNEYKSKKKELEDALQKEYQKIDDWGLSKYKDQIVNGTLPSKFGNIDMNNRTIINWTKETVEQYKDALQDIFMEDDDGTVRDYYSQLVDAVQNGEEAIDSVLGGSLGIGNNYKGISEIAYSSIVDNDDGSVRLLGEKTAEEYIYGILDTVKKDGDLSIDHILELDKKGYDAEVYNTQGEKIGEEYIHGIISGFNEDAKDIGSLTHFAGKDGAINIINQQLSDLEQKYGQSDYLKIKNFLNSSGINTIDQLQSFNDFTKGIDNAEEAIQKWNKLSIKSGFAVKSAEEMTTFKGTIDEAITSYNNLNAAILAQETGKAVTMTDELSGYTDCLEYNNGVMQINTERAKEKAKATAEEKLATIEANAAQERYQYTLNQNKIRLYTEALGDNNSAVIDGVTITRSMLETLKENNSQIVSNAKNYELMASQIRQATGTYQAWLDAQNAPDQGTMFTDAGNAAKAIIEGLGNGKIGTEKFKAAVEFIMPDDIDPKNEKQVKKYLEKVKRYLADNGSGVNNFIADSISKGLMESLGDNKAKLVDGTTVKDFVDKLGITEEVARAMFGEMETYGWDFDWGQGLDTLDEVLFSAQSQYDELKQNLEKQGFNVDVDDSQLRALSDDMAKVGGQIDELTQKVYNSVTSIKDNADFSSLEEDFKKLNDLKEKYETAKTTGDNTGQIEQQLKSLTSQLSEKYNLNLDDTDAEGVLKNLQNQMIKISGLTSYTLSIADNEAQKKLSDLKNQLNDINKQIDELSNKKIQNNLDARESTLKGNTKAQLYAKIKNDAIDKQLDPLLKQQKELKTQVADQQAVVDWIANVKLDLDMDSVDAVKKKQSDIENDPVNIQVDQTQIDAANRALKKIKAAIDLINSTPINLTMPGQMGLSILPHNNSTASKSGDHEVNGTQDLGVSKTALIGELGREIVVDPSTGKWRTYGNNGAEFAKLPQHAIVFNHKQTEDLLERGFVNSRGLAFASGNAFGGGNKSSKSYSGTNEPTGGSGVQSVKVSGDNSIGNAQKTADKAPKATDKLTKSTENATEAEGNLVDWIERRITLLDNQASLLSKKSSSAYLSYFGMTEEQFKSISELMSDPTNVENYTEGIRQLGEISKNTGKSMDELQATITSGKFEESRLSANASQLKINDEKIQTLRSAIEQYQAKYEGYMAKIPQEYRDKIESGALTLENFAQETSKDSNAKQGSSLYDNLQKGIEYYDKVKSSESSLFDTQEEHYKILEEKHNNYIGKLEKENTLLQTQASLTQKGIDLAKASGHIVSADSYESLISNNKLQQNNVRNQINGKIAKLKELDPKEDTEEYLELENEIESARVSLKDLKLEQANLNKELKEMPITNMTTVINMYKDISTAIQNWGAELEASGTALTADYYQELIKNGSTIISEYKEQAGIIKDVMDTYDVGSDNWNELYSQLQNVNGEMSSMIQNLKKWNEELLQLPLTKISNYSSDLNTVKDALSSLQDDYSTVISAVTGAIDDETKAIQDQQKEFQKNIEKQKDAIQDKIDLLDKQNTKLQLQNQLEQAAYDLQIANTQKTQKIIRNGEEIYVTDADKIREAQKAYQDAQFSKTKNDLQEQLDALNDQLDDYNDKVDEQLEALDKIKDKWSEIAENVTKAQNATLATDYLGSGWKDKVLSGNDNDIYTVFKNRYEQNASQLKAYENQIQSTERIYNLLNSYIEAYKAGTITANEAYSQIDRLLSQLNDGLISADANLMNVLQYSKDITGASGSTPEQVLAGIKDDLKTSGQDLLASLRKYEENSKLIGEQTTSWQQLTKDVSEMLSVLKDVKKALKESERDDDDDEDEDDDSSSKKKHHSKSDGPGKSAWSNKDENNGPGAEINRKKAGIAHSGLEAGVVGSGVANDDEAWMKLMGLKELDPNEYPYILKAGEQIVNDEQRKTLMSNFNNAYSSAYADGIKRGISAMSSLGTQVNNAVSNVKVNIEKIMMNNVQDPDGFAKALYNNLELTMAQQRSKFKF